MGLEGTLELIDQIGLVKCPFKGGCIAPLVFPGPWIGLERLEALASLDSLWADTTRAMAAVCCGGAARWLGTDAEVAPN